MQEDYVIIYWSYCDYLYILWAEAVSVLFFSFALWGTQGSRLEIPLWLAKGLYDNKRRLLSVELPKIYRESWRMVFSADANVVDLHKMGPYYYGFGSQLLNFDRPENADVAETVLQVKTLAVAVLAFFWASLLWVLGLTSLWEVIVLQTTIFLHPPNSNCTTDLDLYCCKCGGASENGRSCQTFLIMFLPFKRFCPFSLAAFSTWNSFPQHAENVTSLSCSSHLKKEAEMFWCYSTCGNKVQTVTTGKVLFRRFWSN